MRNVGTRIAGSRVVRRVIDGTASHTRPRASTLLVLTYHRVAECVPDSSLYPGLISATPSDFASQMRWLIRRHSTVSIFDVLDAKAGGTPLPPGSVLVTFDDAYRDFAEVAWPVMRELRIPSTLFVPTAYPAGNLSFWWDRLWRAFRFGMQSVHQLVIGGAVIEIHSRSDEATFRRIVRALKGLPHQEMLAMCDHLGAQLGTSEDHSDPGLLNWADIRTLAAQGVGIAPHSRTHPRLDRLPVADLENEIHGSVVDLRDHVPGAVSAFAYPDGAYSGAVVSAAVQSGIETAFTTRRGRNILGPRTPWHELRRINVGRRTDVAILAGQLLFWSRMAHGVARVP